MAGQSMPARITSTVSFFATPYNLSIYVNLLLMGVDTSTCGRASWLSGDVLYYCCDAMVVARECLVEQQGATQGGHGRNTTM